ncbi:MAG: lipocalin family protein [Kangiellaceae bacterium]|nr:lipocalin family protein [Kangiellaceae bacterium]
MRKLLYVMVLFVTGCASIPDGVKPVKDFELDRYLGTWYEIARLDHSFERGMSNVTATYNLKGDGGVGVLNKGYKAVSQKWKQAEGKAYFVDEPTTGRLKVSFFGPFYGGYNIIALEPKGGSGDYQYSLVVGPDRDYLWILSRQKSIPEAIKQQFLQLAQSYNYAIDKLIWVDHSMTQ